MLTPVPMRRHWEAWPSFSAHFGQKPLDAAFCGGNMLSIADLLRKAEHAPTAPTAKDDTTLASRTLIP